MYHLVMRRFVSGVVLSTVCLLAACVAQPAPPGSATPTSTTAPTSTTTTTLPTNPPTLMVTSHATGLNRPWDIAFTPDGTMLFTERVGRINAWIGGAKRVLAAPADVVALSESGMLGLAVDPQFATNRRIYTCFMSNVAGPLDVRVVRWQVDATFTTLTGRTDIVTGLPVNQSGQTGRHGGCRTRFGPDNALWVTTGDSATGSVPQDPRSLGGKVLRVNTDGTPASGNPGGALDPRIYTLGHRHPQGLAFRSNGQAYSVEHGTACDDEINKLTAGANFGWHPVPLAGGTGYDESRPMTDPARVPGAIAAVWRSGCPTIAPSGATFLSGPRWRDWNGALALAVLKDTHLFVVELDAPGNAVTRTWTAIEDQGRLRSAVQGPDGNLYLTTDADPGRILKVVPS